MLSVQQIILKKLSQYPQKLSRIVFNIDINKYFLSSKSAYWFLKDQVTPKTENDAENSALPSEK